MFGDKTDHFSNADGLSSDSVEAFFQDREGNLWVATTKGIDSFRDLPVVSYSIKEGLVSDSVSTAVGSLDTAVTDSVPPTGPSVPSTRACAPGPPDTRCIRQTP